MFSELIGKKFIFAILALGSLSILCFYALRKGDAGTAMALVGALGTMAPAFLASQAHSDKWKSEPPPPLSPPSVP